MDAEEDKEDIYELPIVSHFEHASSGRLYSDRVIDISTLGLVHMDGCTRTLHVPGCSNLSVQITTGVRSAAGIVPVKQKWSSSLLDMEKMPDGWSSLLSSMGKVPEGLQVLELTPTPYRDMVN